MDFKEFYKDDTAHSDSFFLKRLFGGISEKDSLKLIEHGNRLHETVRFCLHNSPDDLLQLMYIYHPRKKDIAIKKYLSQSSIYMLLDGEFSIELFDAQYNLIERVHLSVDDLMMYRVPQNQFYKMSILSDTLLYLEIRNGPFIRENQIILEDVVLNA